MIFIRCEGNFCTFACFAHSLCTYVICLIFISPSVIVKGSNRSVLQLTKASLSLYIDREKRREKEESRVRRG